MALVVLGVGGISCLGVAALIMYVVCALGKVSMLEFTREVWPFFLALVAALLIVTYVPTVSMWLPNLLLPLP